jgi:hypothetical protein
MGRKTSSLDDQLLDEVQLEPTKGYIFNQEPFNSQYPMVNIVP